MRGQARALEGGKAGDTWAKLECMLMLWGGKIPRRSSGSRPLHQLLHRPKPSLPSMLHSQAACNTLLGSELSSFGPLQGIIKPALQRLRDSYSARARELADEMLVLQVGGLGDMGRGVHASHGRWCIAQAGCRCCRAAWV